MLFEADGVLGKLVKMRRLKRPAVPADVAVTQVVRED
jgi:hypothetical protein